MISLVDDCLARQLIVTVDAAPDPNRELWRIVFDTIVPAYANRLEEYRLGEEAAPGSGWTQIVDASPWIQKLRSDQPIFVVEPQSLTHYRIWTEVDVLDILSTVEPRIERVDDPAADA